MHVETETATVYRAGGRRWFTEWAAYRARAKEMVRERHADLFAEIREYDHGPGHAPESLVDEVYALGEVVERLARFLRFVDRRRAEQAKEAA